MNESVQEQAPFSLIHAARLLGRAMVGLSIVVFVAGIAMLIWVLADDDRFGPEPELPFSYYLTLVLAYGPPIVIASTALAVGGMGLWLYSDRALRHGMEHEELLDALYAGGDATAEREQGASEA